MPLTNRSRLLPNERSSNFPTLQFFFLSICRVAEPIALTSCFPYAWLMIKDFNIGSKDDASFYAGVFISSFALAEALTGVFWGTLSDKVGRKPILLSGCIGTIVSLLAVGFATNFWVALAGRAVGGLLNGNMGVIQTMVGEFVQNPKHEPKAYAVMPFVWSVGAIVGPSIGGILARPADTFPRVFSSTGVFATFPYLLPNLVCSLLLLISVIFGFLFLVETHPDMQSWSTKSDLKNTTAETPQLAITAATGDAAIDLRADTYGTFSTVEISEEKSWLLNADGTSRPSSVSSISGDKPQAFTRKVVMIIIALGFFTYHSMTYDHLLPIFFQDDRVRPHHMSPVAIPGGLGLSTTAVGVIMSVNGLIALFIQAIVFPIFTSWLGVWRTFVLVTVLHPIGYFIVPFLAFVEESELYLAIYACLTIRNFTSILAYPLLLIMLKEAVAAPSVLGKVNGLAASGGSAARTIAPPIAGYLYTLGSRIRFTGLAYWVSALVAIVGAFQILLLQRTKNKTATIRPMASFIRPAMHEGTTDEIVHIMVTDEDEEV